MAALIFFFLNLDASIFKSKSRLEAENAALRRQPDCAPAQDKRSRPLHEQRPPILHPAVSLGSFGGVYSFYGELILPFPFLRI
jgi:hypothetical protein